MTKTFSNKDEYLKAVRSQLSVPILRYIEQYGVKRIKGQDIHDEMDIFGATIGATCDVMAVLISALCKEDTNLCAEKVEFSANEIMRVIMEMQKQRMEKERKENAENNLIQKQHLTLVKGENYG